jgi:hypothetical protein
MPTSDTGHIEFAEILLPKNNMPLNKQGMTYRLISPL